LFSPALPMQANKDMRRSSCALQRGQTGAAVVLTLRAKKLKMVSHVLQ
jgi:hypothetical protein